VSAFDLAIAVWVALTAGWIVLWLRRRRVGGRLARLTRPPAAAPARRWAGRSELRQRVGRALLRRPLASGLAVVSLACGASLLLAGPVAAVVAALYSVMALVGAHRRQVRRDGDRTVGELLDAIDAASGELRAGIPAGGQPSTADTAGTGGAEGGGRRREEAAVLVARARLAAAHRLSDSLGVPLADLLDRVDADLRAGQALRGGVAAQTSSAQATTVVLLAMPLVGLWVGAALGTDPVRQLLHTPFGAACAVAAVGLQCGGFLWTSRMVHAVTAEVR
jgi:tight adherence protein B